MTLLSDLVRDLHVRVDGLGNAIFAGTDEMGMGDGEEFDNRQCIQFLQDRLLKGYSKNVTKGNYTTSITEAIDIEYNKFYELYGHLLGHYFRTIYNIVKFVDSSALSEEQKMFYTNLVRAQLSKYELGLLFYNCLSRYGRKRFLPLIIKYRLLKHLEDAVLGDPGHRKLIEQP